MELLSPVYASLIPKPIMLQPRRKMIPLTFTILGAAASIFLTYVFLQFRRELLQLRSSSALHASLKRGHLREASTWKLARSTGLVSGGQQTKDEVVMRKEILVSATFGAIGLLAPFIFVTLLSLFERR